MECFLFLGKHLMVKCGGQGRSGDVREEEKGRRVVEDRAGAEKHEECLDLFGGSLTWKEEGVEVFGPDMKCLRSIREVYVIVGEAAMGDEGSCVGRGEENWRRECPAGECE